MAAVQLTPSSLTVLLTRTEKFTGFSRDVRVPLTAVRDVEVVDHPLREVRGLRAPGLDLPGVRKIGTWRRRGERTFVCVRKGQPAVRIRLADARFDVLLIGSDDAAADAAAIRATLSPAG
jgi:hypothetical protein